MHRLLKSLALLSLVLVFASFPTLAAHAAALSPQVAEIPSLNDLLTQLLSLTGVAALFAALINLGKKYLPQWFPDGSAPAWSLGLQFTGLVGLIVLQFTGNLDLVPMIDAGAGALANLLVVVLSLGYQIYSARRVHQEVFAGFPVIGASYSGHTAGEF